MYSMYMNKKPFYITTTLPYVNAPLHMGHALEFVRADILARYKNLMGFEVFFNTGTDEHGVKIYNKAIEQGKGPQAFVDDGFATFQEQIKQFGVMDTIHFIRTTDEHHITFAQAFWNKVSDNGYIYKGSYDAKYCVGCESEKTDSELVDGFCPEHPGVPLEIIQEENYFFKYSAFTEKLLALYESRPDFVVPDFRLNEVKEFVKQGLQDFSISRKKSKMPWGIPVPGDGDQVMYVWFDALTNYVSTFGVGVFSPPDNGEVGGGFKTSNPTSILPLSGEEGNFEKFWVNGTPTQYCGKDNNRFQSAMWQAMLMAANLPNSHQIIVNGFITGGSGVRMSKTLGNVVDPRDVVSEYGTDALRMFLAKEISPWEDSPFTTERFADAYNANLVNGLGNLVSRTLTMAENYSVDVADIIFPVFSDIAHPAYVRFDYAEVTNDLWREIADLDKYITDTEPFKMFKMNPDQAKSDVHHVVTGLARIAVLLQPIMPTTAEKMMELIKAGKKPSEPLFGRK
jgi:methionyl-tRNA synthetase